MDKNVYAYTAPGADLPAFISVKRVGGSYFVEVRSPGGTGAAVHLTREQAADLGASLHAAVLEK
jgi:hypothetical protein